MPQQESQQGLNSNKISRRDALKIFGGIVSAAFIPQYMFDIPDVTDEVPYRHHGYPGWMEQEVSPGQFLKAEEGGHASFVRTMTMRHPMLNKICSRAYADLIQEKVKKKERPTLLETVNTYKQYAIDSSFALYGSAYVSDVVSGIMYGLSAIHSNFFTNGEVRGAFGAPLDFTVKPNNLFDISPYEYNIARVFENGRSKFDKMMHFSNFGFLTYHYWMAKEYGLPEAKEIPNIAYTYATLSKSTEESAEHLSSLGQFVWEGFETVSWIDNLIAKGRYIPPKTGYLDPELQEDLEANRHGIQFALSIAKKNLTQYELDEAIKSLEQA